MSDDEERLRLVSIQHRLADLEARYDRFGSEQDAKSIEELQIQMTTIPERILQEDKVNQKLAELDRAIRGYVTRRRINKLPAVVDIWETVKGFEQQHDPQDLATSSLLASILHAARTLNIPEQLLEQTARKAEKAV